MAGSKSTQDVVRAVFLGRILKAWEKAPSLTFGALIVESLAQVTALDRVTDNELAEAVERYVLLRHNREHEP
jgi:hypothetical protein